MYTVYTVYRDVSRAGAWERYDDDEERTRTSNHASMQWTRNVIPAETDESIRVAATRGQRDVNAGTVLNGNVTVVGHLRGQLDLEHTVFIRFLRSIRSIRSIRTPAHHALVPRSEPCFPDKPVRPVDELPGHGKRQQDRRSSLVSPLVPSTRQPHPASTEVIKHERCRAQPSGYDTTVIP